jgi:hypothetical protein
MSPSLTLSIFTSISCIILSRKESTCPTLACKPEPMNILTAMAVGDVHQPQHTAQIFTVEYPQGDRGGNEICVRVTQAGQPMDLHRFWDGLITSSSNLTRLRNEATALRNRQEFQRSQLTELASTENQSHRPQGFI